MNELKPTCFNCQYVKFGIESTCEKGEILTVKYLLMGLMIKAGNCDHTFKNDYNNYGE